MFILTIFIGIYSYIIFFLGLSNLLYKNLIIWITIVLLIIAIVYYKNYLISLIKVSNIYYLNRNKLFILFLLLFLIQTTINLIGVFGPELSFDALWYHLTIPKIWLTEHTIKLIPGGLLYYSAMPKLGELLYTAGLAFGSEINAKLMHFFFGILTCIAIFKISRKYFNQFISLLAVLIFYSNLVIGWESITAYIDLIRAFFEIMALWAFINWIENENTRWFILSAVMIGLAITTKLLAAGSLIIISVLIIYKFIESLQINYNFRGTSTLAHKFRNILKPHYKIRFIQLLKQLFSYWIISLLIPLPWFIFSYLSTGNPFYPFFSDIYRINPQPVNIFSFVVDIWNLFLYSPDPITPIYLIYFPLVIYFFSKFNKNLKLITLYSLCGLIIWYFTPRTGGGRFIAGYLPALSIVCASCVNIVYKNNKSKFSAFLIILILLVSVISISYRFAANYKYIPVLLNLESKNEFLTKHLNFDFGDFYDTDNYFKNNIKSTDKVLLIGFHNLFYVDFPFIDSSWLKPTDKFNYIAVQNSVLPDKYRKWILIYNNDQTMVKLYKEKLK